MLFFQLLIFQIFYKPTRVFHSIRMKPEIIKALLFTGVISLLTYFLLGDNDITQVPWDFTGNSINDLKIVSMTFIVEMGGALFGYLIMTSLLFLFTRIGKSTVTFLQLFSLNLYVNIVHSTGDLVNAGFQKTTNTTLEITRISDLLQLDVGFLRPFDVFYIWMLILLAIGLQKVANLSKFMSWGLPVFIFLLSVLINHMLLTVLGL